LLILSIIALFSGPLLYQWARRGGLLARTVDQVIVAVLVVVVVFLLVPESIDEMGPWAVALIGAGYLVPLLLEKLLKRAAHTLHVIALMLALGGLALHAMLDGAGLAGGELQFSGTLSLAIVLHRFGVGLVLWLMVQPVLGRPVAIGVLVLMAVATVIGYYLSEQLISIEVGNPVHIIQAVIIGTIIHSLVHREHAHAH
jgi:hypothetical protein